MTTNGQGHTKDGADLLLTLTEVRLFLRGANPFGMSGGVRNLDLRAKVDREIAALSRVSGEGR